MSTGTDLRRKRLWHLLLLAIVTVTAMAWYALPIGQTLYPEVVMQAPNALRIDVIKKPYAELAQCREAVARTAATMQAFCPDCEVTDAQCLKSLSPRQRRALDRQPLDMPVMHFARGVILFSAGDPELAAAECQASALQSGQPQICRTPDPAALALDLTLSEQSHSAFTIDSPMRTYGLILLISLSVTWAMCLLIAYTAHWHGRLTFDQPGLGPQNNHAAPVPRVGGLAIACGIVATLLALHYTGLVHAEANAGFIGLAAAAIPAFAGGFGEDITRRVGVLPRLLLTMASGALASVLLGATLTRLDVPLLDWALGNWPLFAIAFTAFAVAGVANATNIIDGANGLVGGFAVLVLGAYGWVAYQVDDQLVLIASLLMLGPVLGFLPWNWPRGRIFMGDGGAYLLGFWLAEIGVLLVVRNPEVSPWFPLLVMAYPVWETLYSIFRRRVLRRKQIGRPDSRHLHQLIHLRLTHRSSNKHAPNPAYFTNSRVLPCLLPWLVISQLIAAVYWTNTPALATGAVAFCAMYVWIYQRLRGTAANNKTAISRRIPL